jgi:hypothetical protein
MVKYKTKLSTSTKCAELVDHVIRKHIRFSGEVKTITYKSDNHISIPDYNVY